MGLVQNKSQDSSASQTKSTKPLAKLWERAIKRRWLILFLTVYYGFILGLVVSGKFTFSKCWCTTPQGFSACTEGKGPIIGDSLLVEETIGYLPYKPAFENKAFHLSGAKAKRENDDLRPICAAGKKSCSNLGHPEICCNQSHFCLPTNNTLTGSFCCGSPDPVNQPCSDEKLSCESGWYECPASAGGGCCKHGQRCGLLQCLEGGADSGDVQGTQDNTSSLRTTIPYRASKATDNTGVFSSTMPPTPSTPRTTSNPQLSSSTKPPSNTTTTGGLSEGRMITIKFHRWIIAMTIGWVIVIAGGL